MADLRNFANWDPGVQSAIQVVGDGGGPDAEFDVTVDAPGGGLELRYRTTAWHPPRSLTVEATSRTFTSTAAPTAGATTKRGAGSSFDARAVECFGCLRSSASKRS